MANEDDVYRHGSMGTFAVESLEMEEKVDVITNADGSPMAHMCTAKVAIVGTAPLIFVPGTPARIGNSIYRIGGTNYRVVMTNI